MCKITNELLIIHIFASKFRGKSRNGILTRQEGAFCNDLAKTAKIYFTGQNEVNMDFHMEAHIMMMDSLQ